MTAMNVDDASERDRPFFYTEHGLCCGAADLSALAQEHGTPLYVYSADQIRQRFKMYREAFADRSHTVCYAVKANSSLAILRMLAQEGAGFDIVSGGELERVRRASRAALQRVVFSGVGKQPWEIDAALEAGILLFNVESEAELFLLAERAGMAGVRARFALRVNPDVLAETHPYISTGLREHKFGVAIGEARGLYRRAAELKWLDAAGVSVHIGSQIRTVEPFAAAMARVLELAGELREDGVDVRYLDAGGGLGIAYGGKAGGGSGAREQVQRYARALDAALGEERAHLLFEPGRFLVAQAGVLVSRVLSVKKNGTKTFVVTDAGMNDLIRPSLYQAHHEIVPVNRPSGRAQEIKVDVVGPVCESGDFFARDRGMLPVQAGDLVAVLDAGAYGMSLSSNYNTRARPAEVLVDGSRCDLIRRRETMEDLFGPELLPPA